MNHAVLILPYYAETCSATEVKRKGLEAFHHLFEKNNEYNLKGQTEKRKQRTELARNHSHEKRRKDIGLVMCSAKQTHKQQAIDTDHVLSGTIPFGDNRLSN